MEGFEIMQIEKTSDKIEQRFIRAVDLTLEKRPALETVIKPFAAVLIKRASILDELKNLVPPLEMDLDADRLSSGVPMVTDILFDALKGLIDKAFAELLPILKMSFPNLAADFSDIALSVDHGEYDLALLAKAYVQGNGRVFESLPHTIGGAPGALGFVVNWTLSAALASARSKWVPAADLSSWSKGYCPFCGSLPSIGSLAKPEGPTSEFLPAGGGQKFLHCALCGHRWRFERNRCPACDTSDKNDLIYYQESGEPAERIDACGKCGRYLLCIDLRKSDASPCMDVTAVGLIHLDILAQDKGYSPMTWTPWNRIDEP